MGENKLGKIIFAKLDPFFFGNRKIMRAGRNGREVFLFALCMNAQRGATGIIPSADLEPWYVAHQLAIPEADARDGVTSAVTAGLLEINGASITIRGWDGDWSRRAKTRAEIQKDYRERGKDKAERYDDEVTRDEQSNALPIRGEERRSEREDALSHTTRSRDAVQALPGAWKPSPEAVRLAGSLGLDIEHERAQFCNWVKSKAKTSADWDAEFDRFLRQSRDVGKKPKKRQQQRQHVSKQRTPDGIRYTLAEADGNVREISEDDYRKAGGI